MSTAVDIPTIKTGETNASKIDGDSNVSSFESGIDGQDFSSTDDDQNLVQTVEPMENDGRDREENSSIGQIESRTNSDEAKSNLQADFRFGSSFSVEQRKESEDLSFRQNSTDFDRKIGKRKRRNDEGKSSHFVGLELDSSAETGISGRIEDSK